MALKKTFIKESGAVIADAYWVITGIQMADWEITRFNVSGYVDRAAHTDRKVPEIGPISLELARDFEFTLKDPNKTSIDLLKTELYAYLKENSTIGFYDNFFGEAEDVFEEGQA